MFSRRGLFKYLPSFLVPAALAAKTEEPVVQLDHTIPTGITHEQLQILAVSLPLPELKILIEKLSEIQLPVRYRRNEEALVKFQYNFPSGNQTWHHRNDFGKVKRILDEDSTSARLILENNNKH